MSKLRALALMLSLLPVALAAATTGKSELIDGERFLSAPDTHRCDKGTHRGTIAGTGGGLVTNGLPPFRFRLSYALWFMMSEPVRDYEFLWIWDESVFTWFPLGSISLDGRTVPVTPALLQAEAPELYQRLRDWNPGLPLEIVAEVRFYSDPDPTAAPQSGFARGEISILPDLVSGAGHPNRLHSPGSPEWAQLFRNVYFYPVGTRPDGELVERLRLETAGRDAAFINRTACKHAKRILITNPRITEMPGNGTTAKQLLADYERLAKAKRQKAAAQTRPGATPKDAAPESNPLLPPRAGQSANPLAPSASADPSEQAPAHENPFAREERLTRERQAYEDQQRREKLAREEQQRREQEAREEELRRQGLRRFFVIERCWVEGFIPISLFSGGTREEQAEVLRQKEEEADAERERLRALRWSAGPFEVEAQVGQTGTQFEVAADGLIKQPAAVIGKGNWSTLDDWADRQMEAHRPDTAHLELRRLQTQFRYEVRCYADRERAEAALQQIGSQRIEIAPPPPLTATPASP